MDGRETLLLTIYLSLKKTSESDGGKVHYQFRRHFTPDANLYEYETSHTCMHTHTHTPAGVEVEGT